MCFQTCVFIISWVVKEEITSFDVYAEYEEEDPDNGSIDDLHHYVAVGFSDDRDMGDDTVIAASFGFARSGMSVQLHYNFVQRLTRTSIRVGDNSAIQDYGMRSGLGSLSATFDIPIVFSYTAPTPRGPVDVTHDLRAGKYIFVAAGPLDDKGSVSYHSVRASSAEMITP